MRQKNRDIVFTLNYLIVHDAFALCRFQAFKAVESIGTVDKPVQSSN